MLISLIYSGDIGFREAKSMLTVYKYLPADFAQELPKIIEEKDKFSDVWENGFKKYRKIDRTCNETCAACPDWKICTGDAFHTWDFKNNKPNFCVRELYKDEFAKRDELRGIKTEKPVKKTTKKSTTKKSTKAKK